MWKSVISSGQRAARTAQHITPTPTLWTPQTSTTTHRAFSAVLPLRKESKEANDWNREELNPQRSEVSKSGTDSELAQHDSAFDPSNTSPESELEATEQEASQKGKKGTLNMSPANKDVHAWKGPNEGGPDRNADREASSRGTPNKRRTIHVKEDGTHVSYR